MFLFHFSAVCGEVSAPPLAVRWGHLHLSGRGPVPAVGQQHQRTACNYQYDLKPTRVHSAHSWLLQNNRARLLSLSQQTQKPAGLHQPLRWAEEGQTHLWAKGRTAVCTGWYPHARHWFVLPESLPVPFFFFFWPYSCCFDKHCCCRHSDRVCQSCKGSPEDGGRAEEVWRVRVYTELVLQSRPHWSGDIIEGWLPCRVVCVGGDGMFSEIIHGLIWRTQIDNGIDLNCPEETLLPCSLRIGIIPAGQSCSLELQFTGETLKANQRAALPLNAPHTDVKLCAGPSLGWSSSTDTHCCCKPGPSSFLSALFLSFRFHRLYLLCHRRHQRPCDLCTAHHCGWVTWPHSISCSINHYTRRGLLSNILPNFHDQSGRLCKSLHRFLFSFFLTGSYLCLGDSQPLDVCSVHHNSMFLRYSVSLLGYGFYGDVLTDSERKRWMGPARYDLSGSDATHMIFVPS